MADVLKARVHLIVHMKDQSVSYRTDVFALARDPKWVFEQAQAHAAAALGIVGIVPTAGDARIQCLSIEWVPSLRDGRG